MCHRGARTRASPTGKGRQVPYPLIGGSVKLKPCLSKLKGMPWARFNRPGNQLVVISSSLGGVVRWLHNDRKWSYLVYWLIVLWLTSGEGTDSGDLGEDLCWMLGLELMITVQLRRCIFANNRDEKIQIVFVGRTNDWFVDFVINYISIILPSVFPMEFKGKKLQD